MPHVSRHVPKGQIAEKIYKELLTHITRKGEPFERARLFSDLITPTERIMLAKRLAIICMLGEGYPFEDIQEVLRVSPSTISRIWEAMQKGKYKNIVLIVQKRKLNDPIIEIIKSFLPRPRTAPRWDFLK